jgi:adenine/guanine phosphoribosyltransferase-like PRPP-binding protein
VDDEVRASDAERVEERIERAGVEAVVARDVEGLIGEAVARQVERDGAVGFVELRKDVSVEVRAAWAFRSVESVPTVAEMTS